MEWQSILVLLIVIPIILIPVGLVWYLNVGGIFAAIRQGRRLRVLATIRRAARIAVTVILPAGIYAFLIWFFLGHFGWQVALAVALALPIVLAIPALVWMAVVSGLFQVARQSMRRRVAAPRRRVVTVAEEAGVRKVT